MTLDAYQVAMKSAGRGPCVVRNLPDRLVVVSIPVERLPPSERARLCHPDPAVRVRFMAEVAAQVQP